MISGTSPSAANKPNMNAGPAKSMKSAVGILAATNQNQSRQPTMGGGLWGPYNTTATNTNTAKPSGALDWLLFQRGAGLFGGFSLSQVYDGSIYLQGFSRGL